MTAEQTRQALYLRLAEARAELSAARTRRRYAPEQERPFAASDIEYWQETIRDIEGRILVNARTR